MHRQVHSIQIDEKGQEPESIDGQIERIPINIIIGLVEVVLKGNGQGCPDNVEEDHQGEKAIPHTDCLRVHIELVPRHIDLLLVMIVTMALMI